MIPRHTASGACTSDAERPTSSAVAVATLASATSGRLGSLNVDIVCTAAFSGHQRNESVSSSRVRIPSSIDLSARVALSRLSMSLDFEAARLTRRVAEVD